jgi:hypothetical protein
LAGDDAESRLPAIVIASEAKQSIARQERKLDASRSLSSGARSRDPLARNDGIAVHAAAGIGGDLLDLDHARAEPAHIFIDLLVPY